MADEKLYGAYVTIRYWCPSICSESDLNSGYTIEEMARMAVEAEGVLGLEDGQETISIEVVPMPEGKGQ